MSPPLAVVSAAEAFWSAAGVEPVFPRDMRRAVTRSQPISVVTLSALHVATAEAWLRRQGLAIAVDVGDRPLRACLVAHAGHGFIFVDGVDGEDEQRFSLAHELAHFLLDYQAPRRAAVARLGESILDVLDGRRLARPEERIVGILTEVALRPHVHLMGRFDELNMPGATARSESHADSLALELLAPWESVAQHVTQSGRRGDRPAIAHSLMERFGLPKLPAERYAASFAPAPLPNAQLLRFLRTTQSESCSRNVERDGLPYRK